MKKDNIYLLTIITVEIVLIVIIIWMATHSEFVSHAEFMAGLASIFVAMSSGFWALWSRISSLAEKMGYIQGKHEEKKVE